MGWLLVPRGKTSLPCDPHCPDWESVPREEPGTGDSQGGGLVLWARDLPHFGLSTLWFCPRCRGTACPSEAGGGSSRGSPRAQPECPVPIPVPHELQGWGCSTGMLLGSTGGAENPGLACLLVLETIKICDLALFWGFVVVVLLGLGGGFFLFCDFFLFAFSCKASADLGFVPPSLQLGQSNILDLWSWGSTMVGKGHPKCHGGPALRPPGRSSGLAPPSLQPPAPTVCWGREKQSAERR